MLNLQEKSVDSRKRNKDFMTNIETWNNEMSSNSSSTSPVRQDKPTPPPENATTRPGAQKYNQVVNNSANKQPMVSTGKTTVTAEHTGEPLSPSFDLNLKIESCKKVWEQPGSTNAAESKSRSKQGNVSEGQTEAIGKRAGEQQSNKKPALMSLTTKKIEPAMNTTTSNNSLGSKQNPKKVLPLMSSSTTLSKLPVDANKSKQTNKNVCAVKPTQQQTVPLIQAPKVDHTTPAAFSAVAEQTTASAVSPVAPVSASAQNSPTPTTQQSNMNTINQV